MSKKLWFGSSTRDLQVEPLTMSQAPSLQHKITRRFDPMEVPVSRNHTTTAVRYEKAKQRAADGRLLENELNALLQELNARLDALSVTYNRPRKELSDKFYSIADACYDQLDRPSNSFGAFISNYVYMSGLCMCSANLLAKCPPPDPPPAANPYDLPALSHQLAPVWNAMSKEAKEHEVAMFNQRKVKEAESRPPVGQNSYRWRHSNAKKAMDAIGELVRHNCIAESLY